MLTKPKLVFETLEIRPQIPMIEKQNKMIIRKFEYPLRNNTKVDLLKHDKC